MAQPWPQVICILSVTLCMHSYGNLIFAPFRWHYIPTLPVMFHSPLFRDGTFTLFQSQTVPTLLVPSCSYPFGCDPVPPDPFVPFRSRRLASLGSRHVASLGSRHVHTPWAMIRSYPLDRDMFVLPGSRHVRTSWITKHSHPLGHDTLASFGSRCTRIPWITTHSHPLDYDMIAPLRKSTLSSIYNFPNFDFISRTKS